MLKCQKKGPKLSEKEPKLSEKVLGYYGLNKLKNDLPKTKGITTKQEIDFFFFQKTHFLIAFVSAFLHLTQPSRT